MVHLKTKHSHKNKAFSGFGCFFIYAKSNNIKLDEFLMMPNGVHAVIILMGIVGARRGVPLRFLCASVSLWQRECSKTS